MTARRVAAWSAGALVAVAVGAAAIAWFTSRNDCGRPSASGGDRMKGLVHCEYGSPDVVKLDDLEKPVPGDDQVLVRVRAASVNPLDWHTVRGTPYVGRLGLGLRVPKDPRLGVDYAGTVEAVGSKVTRFKPGDDVFGGRSGSFAQYVTARADRAIALKPSNVTFEEAGAVAVAGVTALQGLLDQGRLQPGEKVLINGASGGVGTFAVQIAKAFGADVTAVCSTRNVELVRSLGADRVIDYTREDFTRAADRYDLILDNVGNHSLTACRRALKPSGRYVMVGGQPGRWVDPLPRAAGAFVLSRFVHQDLRFFLAKLGQKDVTVLRDLMRAGKLRTVIDRRFPLADGAAALRYVEAGHARGKVVLTVD